MLNLKGCALLAGLSLLWASAWGQDAPQGVVLKSQINLATFGAGSGNDCWGYVSETGREYAIVGLNNQVAFVEITDPSNPVIVEQIPHGASTWGDIKVYKGFAYAVTERAGTGMQVIDMRDIDNGNVTLVRTIDLLSRAHNVVLDEVNGYVYSVGTRGGTGTSMCFSLADPANPVRVGAGSMTADRYQHDAHVITYTDGPMAGKQIWYGFSEGRGVDVFDVTDKDNPVKIHVIEYPNIGYCHQGWVSEDRKYLYVDDELDESGQGIDTRTLVFNIEDPLNAFFVGSFSTGKKAIDHNQYLVDKFTFQANYRSGLRIFDVADSPESPTVAGWFDTYTPNDDQGFDGAWSTYPFFPSGTVIVSDINGGLFVLDVTEATTRIRLVSAATVSKGTWKSGTTASLAASDNDYFDFDGAALSRLTKQGSVQLVVKLADSSPLSMKAVMEARTSVGKAGVTIWFLNTQTLAFERVSSGSVTSSDSTQDYQFRSDLSKYIDPETGEVNVRIDFVGSTRTTGEKLNIKIDRFSLVTVR